jgi:hypothetical protein
MAVYDRREKFSRKVIFSLPSPVVHTELLKAIHVARGELEAAGVEIWDNTIMVEAHDDEVHVYYDQPDTRLKAKPEVLVDDHLDSAVFHLYFAEGKWKKRTKDLGEQDREAAAQAVERHIQTMRQRAYDFGERIPQPSILDNPDVMEQEIRWWEDET